MRGDDGGVMGGEWGGGMGKRWGSNVGECGELCGNEEGMRDEMRMMGEFE